MGSLIIYLKIKKNLISYSACVTHRKSQSVQNIHLIKVLGVIDIHVWIKTQTQTQTQWHSELQHRLAQSLSFLRTVRKAGRSGDYMTQKTIISLEFYLKSVI